MFEENEDTRESASGNENGAAERAESPGVL